MAHILRMYPLIGTQPEILQPSTATIGVLRGCQAQWLQRFAVTLARDVLVTAIERSPLKKNAMVI